MYLITLIKLYLISNTILDFKNHTHIQKGKIVLKEPESYKEKLRFLEQTADIFTQKGTYMANSGYPRKYLSAKVN